eukprot:Sspe_Gene.41982::Locus_20350_Transcript_1_1_Confidence_1.000_Length_1641::g.41982::m.41982
MDILWDRNGVGLKEVGLSAHHVFQPLQAEPRCYWLRAKCWLRGTVRLAPLVYIAALLALAFSTTQQVGWIEDDIQASLLRHLPDQSSYRAITFAPSRPVHRVPVEFRVGQPVQRGAVVFAGVTGQATTNPAVTLTRYTPLHTLRDKSVLFPAFLAAKKSAGRLVLAVVFREALQELFIFVNGTGASDDVRLLASLPLPRPARRVDLSGSWVQVHLGDRDIWQSHLRLEAHEVSHPVVIKVPQYFAIGAGAAPRPEVMSSDIFYPTPPPLCSESVLIGTTSLLVACAGQGDDVMVHLLDTASLAVLSTVVDHVTIPTSPEHPKHQGPHDSGNVYHVTPPPKMTPSPPSQEEVAVPPLPNVTTIRSLQLTHDEGSRETLLLISFATGGKEAIRCWLGEATLECSRREEVAPSSLLDIASAITVPLGSPPRWYLVEAVTVGDEASLTEVTVTALFPPYHRSDTIAFPVRFHSVVPSEQGVLAVVDSSPPLLFHLDLHGAQRFVGLATSDGRAGGTVRVAVSGTCLPNLYT